MSVTEKALWVIERNHNRDLTLEEIAQACDEWLPAHNLTSANAPSIERHKQTFDPRTGEGGVDVWIPIEG
jgi:predicted transcriptional regulator YdeE